MKNTSKQIDRKILKTLEPLNQLNPLLLDELSAKSIIDEVPADRIICRHGDTDSRQIYLLSGQIEVVIKGETKTKIIKSKSALKTPIAEGSPRTATLKTKTASTLLYIDADLLELLMSDEPELTATYEVTEITADDSDDWMLTFLQSPAFLQLPTENIQKLLTRMEEIPVNKDQVIINQGAKDDNYYIIKSGSCNVSRQPYKGSASVLLATLPTGSGFGEEALIINGSRNATITMRKNGTLMRLKKNDFLTLLINPLITYFQHSETQKKLDEGCVVIDVRSEKESKQKPLNGSVNIPLSMLRIKFDSLNVERKYLLVCNDGSQSAAAAFLMIQNGFKCSVLQGGMSNAKSKSVAKTVTPEAKKETATPTKETEQVAAAEKQTQKIAAQQEQIKAAREKAEQDIIRHKKVLSDSRARIAAKNKKHTPVRTQTANVKEQVQVENKVVELQQKESNAALQRAEEMMKQSTAAAEQTRKKAEEEATLIKQHAIEEAEQLRAEKAKQELAKAQSESKAIELQQKESNAAMQRAEEMLKQSTAAVEKARKQAEEEAALIKQRAIDEAEYLRAEVETARQKMEQDAARIKEEEEIIKKSALKMKNEADEIRREAMNDAQQIRTEIEATRELLENKLQQTQDEEKLKHNAILAEAKKQADKLSSEKTQQAAAEAKAIRQKAKEDAARLHNELEETRKQIEAEAARVISNLKEQSQKAEAEQKIQIIEEEVVVELVTDTAQIKATKPVEESVDYKSVSIPGMSAITPIDDEEAKRKAEAIKAKLTQTQENIVAQQDTDNTKVHKTNNRTIIESEDDLFLFQEPATSAKVTAAKSEQPAVAQRTKAESELTQIAIKPQKSVVIYPQQEQETAFKNNPFLNNEEPQAASVTNYASQSKGSENNFGKTQSTRQFDKQAYMRKHQSSKSNTLAIAASFLMILAGAVFTLHATNTLKVQSIAALFNSGNDTVQTTAIAKTKSIRKKVLRADTKVNVKKKVSNKMDNIMQGWKNVLSEAENPKKPQNNR
jgi:rhodanese-related sulfurtransferase